MKKIYAFIVLTFLFAEAKSQVPGYLGKRWMATYQPGGFIALNEGTYKSGFNGDYHLGKNLQQEIKVDYVVSRDYVIGINAGKFNTSFHRIENEFGIPITYLLDDHTNFLGIQVKHFHYKKGYSYQNYRNYDYNGEYFLPKQEQVNLESINSKITGGGGNIAPLGSYIEWSLKWMKNKYHFAEIHSDYFRNHKTNDLLLTLTFGKQLIFADRILFNYGLQFGSVLTAIPDMFGQPTSDPGQYYLHKKLNNIMAVNLKLGIGLLAF